MLIFAKDSDASFVCSGSIEYIVVGKLFFDETSVVDSAGVITSVVSESSLELLSAATSIIASALILF